MAAAAMTMLGSAMAQDNAVRPPAHETSYWGPYAPGYRPPQAESNYQLHIPRTETNYGAEPAALPTSEAEKLEGAIRVALFADPGSTQKESRDAMWDILSKADGIQVEKVTTETVRSEGFFDQYDVFILPGGFASRQARAIDVDAAQKISQKLKEGKGLVAVCAGGYYVVEGWDAATGALDLINAQNHDGKHWARGQQFITVQVTDAGDGESSRTIWYENGPIFKPAQMDGLPEYVSLVKYVTDLAAKDAPTGQMEGRDAVIAAPYGKGRVVAFGPHPELSPGLNHWLINAITWAAGRRGTDQDITANVVLEGAGGQ